MTLGPNLRPTCGLPGRHLGEGVVDCFLIAKTSMLLMVLAQLTMSWQRLQLHAHVLVCLQVGFVDLVPSCVR
jgi:hypothetical protein